MPANDDGSRSSWERLLDENALVRNAVWTWNLLPVAFVLALITWSYYAFVVRLCVAYLLEHDVGQGVAYLIVYHILLVLMMWSYFRAILTNPGTPEDPVDAVNTRLLASPPGTGTAGTAAIIPMESRTGSASGFQQPSAPAILVKNNGKQRFCQKCRNFKPDRTHHCRVCRRCILKMDHHCPWLNTCIGHRNQKFFYLFIIYATVYSSLVALATLIPTIKVAQESDDVMLDLDLNWSFLILVSAVFALCLVGFCVYHTTLILSNQTTIESLQVLNYRVKQDGDVVTSKYLNLFDVGKRNNWRQVMGDRWYLWLIPIGSPHGNGHAWPLNAHRYNSLRDSVEDLTNVETRP